MCTFQRSRVFVDHESVGPGRCELLRTAESDGVAIVAYCFMPDHLHFLSEGTRDDSDTERFARRFRQITSFSFKRERGIRLWQEGYFDRTLRDDDCTLDVVAYIVNNPLRAGLCESIADYPFSGSSRYSLEDIASAIQWRPR